MHAFYFTPLGHDPCIAFFVHLLHWGAIWLRVCVAIGFKGSRNPSNVEKENVLLLRVDAKTISMVCVYRPAP